VGDSRGESLYLASDRESLTGYIEDLCRSYSVKRVALSDASILDQLGIRGYLTASGKILLPPWGEWAKARLDQGEAADFDEFKNELATADLGMSSVSYAIAETGTLVCVAEREQNRLVSLIPPVHVALLASNQIVSSLDEVLYELSSSSTASAVSRAITLITGPSRTADIELTLAIGVHGPKEVHAIILKPSVYDASHRVVSQQADQDGERGERFRGA